MMQETLDELLSNPMVHIYKELDPDQNGNRVLDVRWFNVILRVTVNSDDMIIHEDDFDFKDLYEEETGWWNEA